MPTIEEVESDILTLMTSLSSDMSTAHNAMKTVGILEFTDIKQFEKGINKQILRLEDLRTKVRTLDKLRRKNGR